MFLFIKFKLILNISKKIKNYVSFAKKNVLYETIIILINKCCSNKNKVKIPSSKFFFVLLVDKRKELSKLNKMQYQ